MMIERKQLKGLLQRYRDLLLHYLQLKSQHESWLSIIKVLEEVLEDYYDIEDEVPLSDPALRDAISYIQKKIIPKKTVIPFLQKQGITLQNRIVTIENFSHAMESHIEQIQNILQNTETTETAELLLETPILEQQYQVLKLSHDMILQKPNDLHEFKELQNILQPVTNLNGSPYSAETLKQHLAKNPELQNLYELMVQLDFICVKVYQEYVQANASWELVKTLSLELAKELNLEKQLKDELELKLQQESHVVLTPTPTVPSLTPFGRSNNEKDKE